jgi:carbon monoxide dehydrogenase subunit G
MGRVAAEIQVNKPVAETFKMMADTSNWHKFEAELVDVKPKGPVSKGLKGTETRKMGGKTVDATWEITEFEPNKKFTMAWAGKGMSGVVTNTYAEASGGTRLGFTMDYKSKGLLMMLMAPMISMQFKKTTKNMMDRTKSAIEGGK